MTGFLLVGEAPNAATVGHPHLWLLPDDSGIPHTANRLLQISGWTRAEFAAVFTHRDNVMALPPARWNNAVRALARRRAQAILWAVHQVRHVAGVVCLGKKAAEAFGVPTDVVCQLWRNTEHSVQHPVHCAYLPHTSGLNRWWNDTTNLCMGQSFLRSLRDEVVYLKRL